MPASLVCCFSQKGIESKAKLGWARLFSVRQASAEAIILSLIDRPAEGSLTAQRIWYDARAPPPKRLDRESRPHKRRRADWVSRIRLTQGTPVYSIERRSPKGRRHQTSEICLSASTDVPSPG